MLSIKHTQEAIKLNEFILNNAKTPHERDEARFRLKFLKGRLRRLYKQRDKGNNKIKGEINV